MAFSQLDDDITTQDTRFNGLHIGYVTHRDDPEGLGRDIVLMFNSTGQTREYQLPTVGRGMRWSQFVDTAAESPEDIYPDLDGPIVDGNAIPMPHHSLKVFVSQK